MSDTKLNEEKNGDSHALTNSRGGKAQTHPGKRRWAIDEVRSSLELGGKGDSTPTLENSASSPWMIRAGPAGGSRKKIPASPLSRGGLLDSLRRQKHNKFIYPTCPKTSR